MGKLWSSQAFTFVADHTPAIEEGLLPGLCLYTELWLAKVCMQGGGSTGRRGRDSTGRRGRDACCNRSNTKPVATVEGQPPSISRSCWPWDVRGVAGGGGCSAYTRDSEILLLDHCHFGSQT